MPQNEDYDGMTPEEFAKREQEYETQLHELRQERDNLRAELVEANDLLRRIWEEDPFDYDYPDQMALVAELDALFIDWENAEPVNIDARPLRASEVMKLPRAQRDAILKKGADAAAEMGLYEEDKDTE